MSALFTKPAMGKLSPSRKVHSLARSHQRKENDTIAQSMRDFEFRQAMKTSKAIKQT